MLWLGHAFSSMDMHLFKIWESQQVVKPFSDYADIFSKSIFSHFSQGAARVDVVFDRNIGAQFIKSQTRVKPGFGAKKSIRKVVSNGLAPLPQVWAQFVSLSESNGDLAAFLAEDLVKRFPNVPAECELVLGGDFVCKEKTLSASREKVLALTCDHEEADIRIILHGLEPTKRGYDHINGFLQRHWYIVALVALLWWNWSRRMDDWWHCTRTTLLSSAYHI